MFPARHCARDFIGGNGDDDGTNISVDSVSYGRSSCAVLSSLWAPYLVCPAAL